MSSIVVLGANGFVGNAVIAIKDIIKPIKAVVRSVPTNLASTQGHITWIKADLTNPGSLINILSENDIVINLAYVSDAEGAVNISLVDNIIEACIYCKVSRLVHCSTAVVVGGSKAERIDESSLCLPVTPYEHTKLKLEQQVINALSPGFDVGILRPTAILGAGGKNLLKLSNSLLYGNKLTNYLKRCLLDNMPMHLVPVRNVAIALLHLAFSQELLGGQVFIASSDNDADNNFQSVENILISALGLTEYIIPPVRIPNNLKRLIFKLLGKNYSEMHRIYDSGKLKDHGFIETDTVSKAIYQFGESIKSNPLMVTQ